MNTRAPGLAESPITRHRMQEGSDATHEPPVGPADIVPRQRSALRRYNTWRKFHDGPRQRIEPLLANLARYPDCVLVAGCQRSGTTMLTRIIARSCGFQRFALTHDDELDAALILAGDVDVPGDRRYCFQTTYLNERYAEYAKLGSRQRLIWVVRNPFSVVHSMMHHWKRFALDELYEGCGLTCAKSNRLRRTSVPWPFGPSRVEKACLSYRAKTSQIFAVRELVQRQQLLIVEYDALVRTPERELRRVFDFIGERYDDSYASAVRTDSIRRADRLSVKVRRLIEEHAVPTYRDCLVLASGDPQS
jgi:Sulfotransferase family